MDSKGREVDWGAVAMAATVMIVEGYDLVIYGNTLPIMLKDAGLGLSVGRQVWSVQPYSSACCWEASAWAFWCDVSGSETCSCSGSGASRWPWPEPHWPISLGHLASCASWRVGDWVPSCPPAWP